MLKERILPLFGDVRILFLLLMINVLGTIYGYIWYGDQLAQTPTHFILFVPDSPTASLFFVFVLVALIYKKQIPLIEAFAAVTLIKYGIWAVAMNIGAGLVGDPLNWKNYMLIASHAGMALQAILYSPYFRIKTWHLLIVAIWTLMNDYIDYVFMMHPWVSRGLNPYIGQIGFFTLGLSLFSILAVYLLAVRKNRFMLTR
ncbi:DUF1405 domain-containing protein [Halalkalibacter sp. AB-rgal2]|uniref:DUF1405 domain-containing protein n=2 Tax=unclassified Halalkalibacter TaxID=2893063 RepID=UPI00359D797C|nr:DUF1405 domain-containing protein [Halalkalibacter sp. APA_J-10(15)]